MFALLLNPTAHCASPIEVNIEVSVGGGDSCFVGRVVSRKYKRGLGLTMVSSITQTFAPTLVTTGLDAYSS